MENDKFRTTGDSLERVSEERMDAVVTPSINIDDPHIEIVPTEDKKDTDKNIRYPEPVLK